MENSTTQPFCAVRCLPGARLARGQTRLGVPWPLDLVNSAQPGHGRFRSYILVALKRFLVNAREHAAAARCGR
jgi:hypothetical protein